MSVSLDLEKIRGRMNLSFSPSAPLVRLFWACSPGNPVGRTSGMPQPSSPASAGLSHQSRPVLCPFSSMPCLLLN